MGFQASSEGIAWQIEMGWGGKGQDHAKKRADLEIYLQTLGI